MTPERLARIEAEAARMRSREAAKRRAAGDVAVLSAEMALWRIQRVRDGIDRAVGLAEARVAYLRRIRTGEPAASRPEGASEASVERGTPCAPWKGAGEPQPGVP